MNLMIFIVFTFRGEKNVYQNDRFCISERIGKYKGEGCYDSQNMPEKYLNASHKFYRKF
ncbi:hypothetical protein BDD39_002954 [Saccharococcus thermophilus]|uniref:Uncharacterized protein n=1 Tax=Saccharococcus thermophilus TaxID=29396 RepID=A0A846MLE6_9BACL|nr:hypothetical protein [Saccharococcus thermophilus]